MNPLIWIRLLAYSERVGFEQQRDRPRRDLRTDAGRPSAAIELHADAIDLHAEPDDSPAIAANGDGSGRLHLTFASADAASAPMSDDGIRTNDMLAVMTINRPAIASDLQPIQLDEVSAVVVMPGSLPAERLGLAARARMDSAEIHAKAIIAAALIANRAVEIPAVPQDGHWSADSVAVRLRDLTDYVYQVLAAQAPGGN